MNVVRRGQWHYAGLLSVLIAAALFLSARLIYLFLADPWRFPINTVKIAANYQHVTHKDLEKVLQKYSEDSFFALPIARLHTELNHLKWIDTVDIERLWPDTLKITLVEKVPYAIWNRVFLTEDGEIIDTATKTESNFLPELTGPIKQHRQVLQIFKKLSKILSIYGLNAASLALRDNHAWELTLSNGVMLQLGKSDLEDKLTRFCRAYPTVFSGKTEQLASIDLRYPSGMAVQWKK